MRYLNHTAASYVGIDLHARTLFIRVLDHAGVVKLALSPLLRRKAQNNQDRTD